MSRRGNPGGSKATLIKPSTPASRADADHHTGFKPKNQEISID
jgi:hypothetical protein